MEQIVDKQKNIVDEFSSIADWEDRYKKIIQIGKDLEDIDEALKVEENKVKGCQSQVWLSARFEDGKIYFVGDSDAMIVRGLVALLLKVYSGQTPDEIIATPPNFISELGFASNLSQSRANGLNAMVKQIKFYALAFKAKMGS